MLLINFTFTFTDPVEELLLTVGDDTFIFTASFREAAEPGCSVQLREGFMHIGYSKLHGYVFLYYSKTTFTDPTEDLLLMEADDCKAPTVCK